MENEYFIAKINKLVFYLFSFYLYIYSCPVYIKYNEGCLTFMFTQFSILLKINCLTMFRYCNYF